MDYVQTNFMNTPMNITHISSEINVNNGIDFLIKYDVFFSTFSEIYYKPKLLMVYVTLKYRLNHGLVM